MGARLISPVLQFQQVCRMILGSKRSSDAILVETAGCLTTQWQNTTQSLSSEPDLNLTIGKACKWARSTLS
ncbi:hypothetical protein Tcan_07902 [Toxocara canis]|uniref:Uncharacterized protein n=1 Tax=Toxocara canis TaxID=6265 RepID=A0A0B2VUL2_TOXCA|nr:hypothetical protein Tcan_07902 [Toxocara canis]